MGMTRVWFDWERHCAKSSQHVAKTRLLYCLTGGHRNPKFPLTGTGVTPTGTGVAERLLRAPPGRPATGPPGPTARSSGRQEAPRGFVLRPDSLGVFRAVCTVGPRCPSASSRHAGQLAPWSPRETSGSSKIPPGNPSQDGKRGARKPVREKGSQREMPPLEYVAGSTRETAEAPGERSKEHRRP